MEIVRLLVNYINMYPDQRFSQILQNLEIIEDLDLIESFYEESEETLKRLKRCMASQGDLK